MRTTVNVQIGMKQYVAIIETGEVFVKVPEKWDHSSALSRKIRTSYWLEIKAGTQKWNKVRQIGRIA